MQCVCILLSAGHLLTENLQWWLVSLEGKTNVVKGLSVIEQHLEAQFTSKSPSIDRASYTAKGMGNESFTCTKTGSCVYKEII